MGFGYGQVVFILVTTYRLDFRVRLESVLSQLSSVPRHLVSSEGHPRVKLVVAIHPAIAAQTIPIHLTILIPPELPSVFLPSNILESN